MKKFFLPALIFSLLFSTSSSFVYAEEMGDAHTASATAETQASEVEAQTSQVEATNTIEATSEAAPVAETAPAVVSEHAAVAESVAPPAAEPTSIEGTPSENLEFISGEITALDEAAQGMTVKLYGETEEGATDKVISIKIDQNTDLTDGEKDRDFKSLTVGTEIDVEYDPASSKATYIFVY